MNDIIVFSENNIVKILVSCTTELTLVEAGEKDIFKDIPFWIIDGSILPETPQETWKLENMGTPSGYGKKI